MYKAPSFVRVAQVDYWTGLALLFPPIFWGLCALLLALDRQESAAFVYVAAATTVVAWPIMLWRYRFLTSVFESGVEVPAVISSIWLLRGKGRVEYVYTFQGKKYLSGNGINNTKRTKGLAQGDNVTVVIDPLNPKRAFIRDLYL